MKRILFFAFLAGLLFVSGCEQVVFERGNRGTEAQIYKMAATGANQANVSNNAFQNYYPCVCPDNKRIVFASSREGYRSDVNIYIMDTNGGNVRQLTTGMGDAGLPRCSSQGVIAFISPMHGYGRIWTVKADGTDLRQVMDPGSHLEDVACDFYDEGRRLVFARYDHSARRADLFATYFDGSQPAHRITNTSNISESSPVVSHHGRFLAYVALNEDTGNVTLRIANVGSWTLVNEIAMQPPAKTAIRGIGFSCDDSRLFVAVESSDVPGLFQPVKYEIFSIKLDGTDQKRLTQDEVGEYFPSVICVP